VTVLFADMSSSVRITAGLHPEDAAAHVNRLLEQMVDVLLKYEGRVDRFLGDGLLAVFGVPQAHESDPDRAIRAALDIREAAQTLGVEITAGINTGEVYVGGMGSERHQEFTVMGPVVNLAARLQGKAMPGQILVGEATYRHTRRAFEFAPLLLEVKGIDTPVAGYAVEHPLARPEKVRGIEGLRAELIGRDEEFAKLRDAFADVLKGRGRMVSLIGEAGLGKSRLVSELKAEVGRRQKAEGSQPTPEDATAYCLLPSAYWLEGRCFELGMSASYWPFLEILRDFFGWGQEDDDASRAQRLTSALGALVAEGGLAEARFDEMVPLLGHLLSVRFGNEWDQRLRRAGPEQIRHQTFMALRDFFLALARRQPLLLVLEDLHWADTLSLDLISLLMETVTLVPILLLCVYRPEREHRCWHLGTIAARKCSERYTEIPLRELSLPQSRRLIESLLEIDNLPPAVKELILQKSGGNPFFVEEVVRSLIDAGMVYREVGQAGSLPHSGVWRAREDVANITVPASIQSVIQTRVDRLDPELKQVLQSASIIGRLFQRRLLEHVTRQGRELGDALRKLEELALIYQEQVIPEEEYSFKHVLTQQTVYQGILRRRRSALHQAVAGAIEALHQPTLEEYYEQLAYHYEQGAPLPPLVRGSGIGADVKAIEYLLKAGEKARRAYLNEEAIGYLRRALERMEAADFPAGQADSLPHGAVAQAGSRAQVMRWRLEALKALGLIYHNTSREDEAGEYFQQAIAVAREMGLSAHEVVRLYGWLAEVLWWQSRYDEIIRLAEEGLALLGDDTECVEAAWMTSHLAVGHLFKGDRGKYREYHYRNARFLQRLPYSEELRPAYAHIVTLYARDKNVAEALRWARSFEQRATEQHDLIALGELYHRWGQITLSQGDLRGAVTRWEQALDLLARIGDTKFRIWSLVALTSTALSLGDLAQAEAYAARTVSAADLVGIQRDMSRCYLLLGRVLLAQRRWGEALEAFQKGARLRQESSAQRSVSDVPQLRGRLALARGERREALAQFQEMMGHTRGAASTLADTLSGLEAAWADREAFTAFCRRFREEQPDAGTPTFTQWFLEPAEVETRFGAAPTMSEAFAGSLAPDWNWVDPGGDGRYVVGEALVLHAANGRDLEHLNFTAPRLLRSIVGDFAAQTICAAVTGVAGPADERKPAIGGLLLWKDTTNFLRLEQGTRGEHEITFSGCVGDRDVIIGRGCLEAGPAASPPASETHTQSPPTLAARVFLRLERRDGHVRALCSADGAHWLTVGQVDFAAADPLEVGLHAIGTIDRSIYLGAHREGTAIRFESFRLWR
jgi:class 3 adenylate cyclase/tetratricopeptide (TPR) repeat protein